MIFHDGVVWLRERKVLLPGVTTLARVVARVRDEATDRLYDALFWVMAPRQRAVFELLLEVPDDRRVSDLERWRQGPSVPSGKSMEKALDRAAQILSVGAGTLVIPPEVPYRRLVDLARYGMQRPPRCCVGTARPVGSRRCWPPSSTWRARRSMTAWISWTC
jgi:hypothetical protein